MKKTVKLNFISSDFEGNIYMDNCDCAVVRAAQRYFGLECTAGGHWVTVWEGMKRNSKEKAIYNIRGPFESDIFEKYKTIIHSI